MAQAAARPSATDAFDAFVQVRSPQLLRTAQLLTGDRAAAERGLTAALAATWRVWGELDGATAAEDHTLRELVAASSRAAGRSSGRTKRGAATADSAAAQDGPGTAGSSGSGTGSATGRVSGGSAGAGVRGRLPEGLGSGDAARSAARSSLRHQLAAMPPELRAVVVLRHAQGLPEDRIAAILGEDVSQVSRAEQAAIVLLARDPDVGPFVGAGA